MNLDTLEILFHETIKQPPEQRDRFISQFACTAEIKHAATKLVAALESNSKLLNDDFVTDIARIDPGFFDTEAGEMANSLQPGEWVNGFQIESVIGKGGMSVVYRARQTKPIKRIVALKFVRPSLFASKTLIRFLREQQALALVSHPNIATLFEVGTTSAGHPFAVMEFVDGEPITAFCHHHAVHSRDRLKLCLTILDALRHAHQVGVVHRDIKPDNILVCHREEQPIAKLIDFGIARIDREDFESEKTVTHLGQFLGSPRYMSPEQLLGNPVDARSDIYSAALVLFELLAREPYRTASSAEDVFRTLGEPFPERVSIRMSKRLRQCDKFERGDFKSFIDFAKRDLDWILTKALARDADQRYPEMDNFINDLNSALENKPVTVSRPGVVTRATRYAKSKPKQLWLLAGIVVAVISGLGWFQWQRSTKDLTAARLKTDIAQQESLATREQMAAADQLIMQMLASDKYQFESEQFDPQLIPAYRAQYERIRQAGGPRTDQDKFVYGILAVLYAMSGDFSRADELMDLVADDQMATELRLIREKTCARYAESAKAKLATLVGEQNAFERARQQVILGRCYIFWNMLSDAKPLLLDAVQFFDTHDRYSVDNLLARCALAKLYEKSGDEIEYTVTMVTTYKRFLHKIESDGTILTSPRSKDILSRFVENVKNAGLDNYEGLK